MINVSIPVYRAFHISQILQKLPNYSTLIFAVTKIFFPNIISFYCNLGVPETLIPFVNTSSRAQSKAAVAHK